MSKPCPFCGDRREPEIHSESDPYTAGFPPLVAACCQHCGARGPVSSVATYAFSEWDDRSGDDDVAALRAEVARLKDLLDEIRGLPNGSTIEAACSFQRATVIAAAALSAADRAKDTNGQ